MKQSKSSSYRRHYATPCNLVAYILLCLSTTYGNLYAGTVTSNNNSGPGTLRQVVMDAMPGDTIRFTGVTVLLSAQIQFENKNLVFIGDPNSPNIIDGGPGGNRIFDVKNGNAEFRNLAFQNGGVTGGSELFGGAIIAHDKLVVHNCCFTDNTATLGGAIALNRDNGVLIATNCFFSNNVAEGLEGGAIYLDDVTSASLNDCKFVRNRAEGGPGELGGALSSKVIDTLSISDCQFSCNKSFFGGSINIDGQTNGSTSHQSIQNCTFLADTAGNGGSIYNDNADLGSLVIDSTSFEGSYATRHGGAIRNRDSSPIISHCTFKGNVAEETGGAIYNDATGELSSPIISKCQFQENESIDGGAISNYAWIGGVCDPIISNSTFWRNTAQQGASIHNEQGFSSGSFVGECSPRLINCSFTQNTTPSSGANIYSMGNDTTFLTNCIMWDNVQLSGTEVLSESSALTAICHSLIDPNSVLGDKILLYNHYVDPKFTEPDEGNLALSSESPPGVTNGGIIPFVNSTTDLAGNPRIVGGFPALGAYEENFSCELAASFYHPNHFVAGETKSYSTDRWIFATNSILMGANVTYNAAAAVYLNHGFEVEEGALFLAKTDGCPP